MKKITILITATAVFFIFCAFSGFAVAEDGWITNPSNGHLYKFIDGCGHWHDCEDIAVQEEAHLVTINDATEQEWINSTFGTSSWHAWIGLTDETQEGTFVWISGEPVTYTNWASGEPNNAFECGEDYAHLHSSGQWNDLGYCGYDWFRVTDAIIEKNGGTEPPPECDLSPILDVLEELNTKIDNLETKLNEVQSKVSTGAVIKTKDLNKGVYFMGAEKVK